MSEMSGNGLRKQDCEQLIVSTYWGHDLAPGVSKMAEEAQDSMPWSFGCRSQ